MAGWTEAAIPDLSGRLAVVTGANSGLGFHTARVLAGRGMRVIMACRDAGKGHRAAEAIRARAPAAKLEVRFLDLADLTSIHEFASALEREGVCIDLLIDNAGVMAVPKGSTRDGFETQFGTNHLGHFALTGRLLERMAPGGRIVIVSSLAHRWTPGIDFDDLHWEKRRYRRWQAYSDSKLANLLFLFELSRRLAQAGRAIVAAGAHPGYADTHLQYVAAEQKRSSLEALAMRVGNALFAQSAQRGALPSLYAATAADVGNGDFIGPDGFRQMRGDPVKVGCRRLARDEDLAARLWMLSERLTGVQYPV